MLLIYTENCTIKYPTGIQTAKQLAYFLDRLTEAIRFLVKYFLVVFSDTNLTVHVIVTTDLLVVDK